MRLQLLRERVGFAHAVLYTHAHVDHLFGFDDVRLFPRHLGARPLPVYCDEETEQTIRRVFSYAFTDRAATIPAGHLPKVRFERITANVPFEVLGQTIVPIALEHGRFRVLGFRVGGLAYCTDVNKIPESSWPLLEGLDVLILDALRPTPHPTHFSLDEALRVVERLRPGRVTSRICRTTWRMRRPSRSCRPAWVWPTMGSPWSFEPALVARWRSTRRSPCVGYGSRRP